MFFSFLFGVKLKMREFSALQALFFRGLLHCEAESMGKPTERYVSEWRGPHKPTNSIHHILSRFDAEGDGTDVVSNVILTKGPSLNRYSARRPLDGGSQLAIPLLAQMKCPSSLLRVTLDCVSK